MPTADDPLSLRVVEALDGRLRDVVPMRVHRAAYRLGYLVLRPWWFLTRPRIDGVKAVITHAGRVLLVRHAYARRDQWDLPGGFVRPGEDPEASLRREVREELGIVDVAALRALAVTPGNTDGKRERLHAFVLDVPGDGVAPERAEIADVRWADPGALPPGTTDYARRMVARAGWTAPGH